MKEKKSKQCLSCGEKIYGGTLLHPPCMKQVFDAQYVPPLDISINDLPDTSTKPDQPTTPFSISHAQLNVPITFNRKQRKLVKGGSKVDYTLKLPLENFEHLPQNQNFSMSIASRLKVPVCPHTLIPLKDNTFAYLVKRPDIVNGKKLGSKTFFQLLGKEKIHSGSLEEIGDKIRRISEIPGLEVQLFFEIVLLSFILGHSDLHFKKFSILYEGKGKNVRLAPMEDLASTKLFQPKEDDFALPMNGKTRDMTGEDFREFSRYLRIPAKAYEKMFLRFFEGRRLIGRRIKQSNLDTDEKIEFADIVNERFKRLLS